MKALFKPAKTLMGYVRYPVKFGIIFLIVLIPLVFLSLNLINSISKDVRFLENERVGLTYIKAIRQPVEHIQQHRGMMAAYLSGATEFRSRIMSKQGIVDEKLAQLREINEQLGDKLGLQNDVAPLTQQWNNIKANSLNMSLSEAIKVHGALVDEMLALMNKAAAASEIALDPKFDSNYIATALASGLPNMLENMGQARALGTGVAAKGVFPSPKVKTRLAVLSENIGLYFKSTKSGLQAAFIENAKIGKELMEASNLNNSAIEEIQALLNDKLLNTEEITVSSDAVFNAATTAISGSYKLYDSLVPALDNLLAERIESGRTSMMVSISIVIVVLLLIAYLFTGFYLSVQQSIAQISVATKKLSEGDLTVQITLDSRDEMTRIEDSFNIMTQKFAQMVRQILESSKHLGNSSNELLSSSVQTHKSISEQKLQTAQVAISMNEMSATVLEVSRNITNTATAAGEANSNTTEGSQKVDVTIQAIQKLAEQIENGASVIQQLEQDGKDISTVLDVIMEVADQTNLLALNAAIEAARAGEHGRGFAVVADEVRNLAGHTQESTKAINKVIEKLQTGSQNAVDIMKKSQEEAKSVVSHATEAGLVLSAISNSAERINEMSTDIASAVEKQRAATEQINLSILSIDKMTNETSTAAQQTSTASDSLSRVAENLQGMVAKFIV